MTAYVFRESTKDSVLLLHLKEGEETLSTSFLCHSPEAYYSFVISETLDSHSCVGIETKCYMFVICYTWSSRICQKLHVQLAKSSLSLFILVLTSSVLCLRGSVVSIRTAKLRVADVSRLFKGTVDQYAYNR